MILRLSCLLIVLVVAPGCTGYLQLVDGMNTRGIATCLKYEGTIRAGAAIGPASGFGAVQGVTATGGADLMQCMARYGLNPTNSVEIPSAGIFISPTTQPLEKPLEVPRSLRIKEDPLIDP